MEIKMYVPKIAEIPSEYLAPLAQRARDSLGDAASTTPATRGHLVRQAIKDGLLRGMDHLIREDGSIDSSGPFYSIQGGIALVGSSEDRATVTWELREETLATADQALWSVDDFELDPA